MNNENTRVVNNLIKDGDARKDFSEWGAAKICYLKALDEIGAIMEVNPDVKATPEISRLKDEVDDKLQIANNHLARQHREKGLAALGNKAYQIAVEVFEEATRLASDEDIEFLEEVKTHLDIARRKERDRLIHIEITPFVERGNDFKESGNFGEAALEYQEALKRISGLPEDHRFVKYIKDALAECRRSMIRPYLSRIYKACHANKFRQASKLLKRAQLILGQDNVYMAFLEQMREKIHLNLKDEDVVEIEEFEEPEVWESAVKDYEEALEMYSSFSIVDPLSPAYTTGVNIYEDKFIGSRRKLGKLYKDRADRLRDQAKIEKAIRNYKEAIKLLPRSDKMYHDAFKEMKKLRAQVIKPS